MIMDLQRLRFFLEVARQKNFTKAAKACHVSQPSLSQQIKKLEEAVEGALFIRNRGAITLSPFGREFLPHAQAVLSAARTAEEFVAESQVKARRTVRLGAIPTIAPYLLPELVETIRENVPNVSFELLENRTEALIEALQNGEIDFALLSPPTSLDDVCDHLTLHRDELLLTLPAKHHLLQQPDISPEELSGETIILLENSHCLSSQTAAYCEAAGLSTSVKIRGSQIDTLLRLVEMGYGLSFTPAIAVPSNQHRKVVFRSIATPPCQREIRLVWLRQSVLTPSQEATIAVARKVAANPAWVSHFAQTKDTASTLPEQDSTAEKAADATGANFTFFSERKELEKADGAYLPHWRQDGVLYFVTFRLADSLPQKKLQALHREKHNWLRQNPEPWNQAQRDEYYERFPTRLQDWLDQGYGSMLLKHKKARQLVEEAIRFFEGERYQLDAFVVAANHVHVLIAPHQAHALEDILQSWKSYSAKELLKLTAAKKLTTAPTVWQKESWDHIVRSEASLNKFREYIQNHNK